MFLGAPVQIAGFTDVAEDASAVPQSVFTGTGRRFGARPVEGSYLFGLPGL